MEHSLGRVQFRDRWENTSSVTGEEDDVARMVRGQAGNFGIFDIFDRVGTASIFSKSSIVVVDKTSLWAKNNVLKD